VTFDYLSDPFKRRTDKLAVVGMAQSTRHKAPWDDDEIEIWILNEMGDIAHPHYSWIKRYDRVFQMHQRWDFMRIGTNFNHWNHPHWLRNQDGPCYHCEGTGIIPNSNKECNFCDNGIYKVTTRDVNKPIYMQEKWDDIPGSVEYPLDKVLEFYQPNAEHCRYFTNTFGYMAALAGMMGYKEIQVFGFEMASGTEYSYQKPNANYWAGILIGKGCTFYLPDGCQLLGYKLPLYGYDAVPEINRMHLEIKRNAHLQKENEKKAEFQQIQGRAQQLYRQLTTEKGMSKKRQEKLQKELAQLQNQGAILIREQDWFRANRVCLENLMAELDAIFVPDADKPKLTKVPGLKMT